MRCNATQHGVCVRACGRAACARVRCMRPLASGLWPGRTCQNMEEHADLLTSMGGMRSQRWKHSSMLRYTNTSTYLRGGEGRCMGRGGGGVRHVCMQADGVHGERDGTAQTAHDAWRCMQAGMRWTRKAASVHAGRPASGWRHAACCMLVHGPRQLAGAWLLGLRTGRGRSRVTCHAPACGAVRCRPRQDGMPCILCHPHDTTPCMPKASRQACLPHAPAACRKGPQLLQLR